MKLKSILILSLEQKPNLEGSLEEILTEMPLNLRTQLQKLCNVDLELSDQIDGSQINMKDEKVKEMCKKIQKVISKNKNVLFLTQPTQYTFKNENERNTH